MLITQLNTLMSSVDFFFPRKNNAILKDTFECYCVAVQSKKKKERNIPPESTKTDKHRTPTL